MVLDLIFAVSAVGGLIGLILVIGKKFLLVSQIDIKKLPETRQNQIKSALIEKRLERKISGQVKKVGTAMKPLRAWWRAFFSKLQARLAEMEQQHKDRLRAARQPVDRFEIAPKLQALETEARALFESGHYADAEKKCIEMIALDHASITAYRLLGETYVAMKSFAEAKEVYRHLIKLNNQDDQALVHLGQIASSEGNLAEAKQDLLDALSINQQIAGTYLELCNIYCELGEYTNAVQECQQAVKLEPNNPKVLSSLLEAALAAKDKVVAWSALDQMKTANPENQKLAELQARVEALDKMR